MPEVSVKLPADVAGLDVWDLTYEPGKRKKSLRPYDCRLGASYRSPWIDDELIK